MELLGIEMSLEEFDYLLCEQSKGKQLKVENGKVIAYEKVLTDNEKLVIAKLDRINELKTLLSETDYKAIKYAEGLILANDYEPIKTLRQSYREEINTLEEEIKALEG